MEKLDITKLHELFDNVRIAESHNSTMRYIVSAEKGDIGEIYYFKSQPNEIRIFVDNFPGQKKEYSTNMPFDSLKEFTEKLDFLGLALLNEERRTSTNSKIGSQHWFSTLIARHLHFGEFIVNNQNIYDDRTIKMGADLFETSKELIRGFKFINK